MDSIRVANKQNLIKTKSMFLFLILSLIFCNLSLAQRIWQRTKSEVIDLQLFHSTQGFNLPTAETLQKGDIQFEISHRFSLPISEGYGELWGFDGSVIMRIGLGYAISNRTVVTLARSNREGNIDLKFKYKAFQFHHNDFPAMISVQAGLAFTGKPVNELKNETKKYQYFGSIIFNTLYKKRLGIGVVPSYLYNSHIYCTDTQDSFTLGGYLQYYAAKWWSLLLEVNPTISGWRNKHDAFGFGIEFETGGHFFKFLVSNSTAMNLSQYLAGSRDSFSSGDWHFGFNITRLL
jgi:hypothetical protein